MTQRNGLLGAALWFVVALIGCDQAVPGAYDTVQSRIEIDLGALHHAALDGAQEICRSVVASVVLAVDGEVQCSETVEPDESSISCPVEAKAGVVAFHLEIFSNNGTLLYEDTTRERIEQNGFRVVLAPEPQNPVLRVCIGPPFNALEIANRGRGRLDWTIIPPPEQCPLQSGGTAPCVVFDPESDILASGGSITVEIITRTKEQRTFDARVASPVGDVGFQVLTGQGRAVRANQRPGT